MAAKDATLPTVAIEKEYRDALQALADEQDVSLGHVVRAAVREYVDRKLGDKKPDRKRPQAAKTTT
jgi:hypothetical protein